MTITHAILSTTLLASTALLAPLAPLAAPSPERRGAEPVAAVSTAAQLAITSLGGSVEALGGGRYTTRLHGSGTLTNGVIVESTTHELTCAVDDNAETLDCAGTLRVAGVAAPLRLRYEGWQARYALRSGFSARHLAAWELWFTEALTDLVPPFDGGDDGGDGGDDGGGGGGWNFPDDIVVGETWTTRDYSSESWTVILDGAVISGLWW